MALRARGVVVDSSSDVLGRRVNGHGFMFPLLLISIVIVPVVFGMRIALGRHLRRSVLMLVAFLLAYDVLYFLMLYYLRLRWVGWG